MSFTDTSRKVSVSLHALETIGKLAKGVVPKSQEEHADQAVGVLSLIVQIYDAVDKGLHDTVNVGDVEREISRIAATLESNDAHREALGDAKFSKR